VPVNAEQAWWLQLDMFLSFLFCMSFAACDLEAGLFAAPLNDNKNTFLWIK